MKKILCIIALVTLVGIALIVLAQVPHETITHVRVNEVRSEGIASNWVVVAACAVIIVLTEIIGQGYRNRLYERRMKSNNELKESLTTIIQNLPADAEETHKKQTELLQSIKDKLPKGACVMGMKPEDVAKQITAIYNAYGSDPQMGKVHIQQVKDIHQIVTKQDSGGYFLVYMPREALENQRKIINLLDKLISSQEDLARKL